MNLCSEIREHLDDWIDGTLTEADRTAIEGHLAKCGRCADQFKRQRALSDGLLALGGIANRIADAEVPKRMRRIAQWRAVSVVAASILLLLPSILFVAVPWRRAAPTPFASNDRQRSSRPDVLNERWIAGPASGPVSEASFVRWTGAEGRIAVPVESRNPRIHIVWIYNEIASVEGPTGGETGTQPASSS